jgi:uncharacterized BrkB/YihY/UPF0761 family membrane protein
MNQLKLIKESLTISLIFSILFLIYDRNKNRNQNSYGNIITVFLFLIWIILSKVGTYYIHLYNSQIM